MELFLLKSNIECNRVVQELLRHTPSILKFDEGIRGWKYKDRNLKISVKHNLLNGDYTLVTNLCGIKSTSTIDASIVKNFGLLKCMIMNELAKLFRYFEIPKDEYTINESRLHTMPVFALCVVTYNIESNTKMTVCQRGEKISLSLSFRENNIMKLQIKTSDNAIKSYYNQAGSIRTKVLGLIRAL